MRRYIIDGRTKYYAQRRSNGQFYVWTARKRGMAIDRRNKARTKVTSGYGHQGDLKKRRRRSITSNPFSPMGNTWGF